MTTKTTEPNPNMELWNSVWQTPPSITKEVKIGTRQFTSACAQFQLKRATELWGTYGSTWGIRNCKYDYIRDVSNRKGAPVGKEIIIEGTLEAVFFYPGGEFEISVDAVFREGGDTRKKLRTEAQSKGLSLLGFSSDLFEGKFDDNKYVAEMREKFGEEPAVDPRTEAAAADLPWDEPAPPPKASPVAEPVTEDQLRDIRAHMPVPFGDGTLTEDRLGKTYAAYNVSDVTKLTRRQAANVLLACKKLKETGK